MDRSLFPDGVEVHQIDLTRESSAKAAAILRRHTDICTTGIVSGLSITVGSDTTKVKISPGVAYTPGGELINVSNILDNIPLADSAVSAINYICLVYTEVQSNPQPHEDLGVSLNTAVVGTYRVAVLTTAQYNALLPTDANLNNNALDRLVILGLVAAAGVGVAINPVSIQNAAAYATIITITQPVNATGVSVTAMDGGVPLGNGTLTFDPAAVTLRWQAPGDSAGSIVPITVDGSYSVPSAAAGKSITVSVQISRLPTGISPVTDILTISSLYSQSIARFTPRDEQHRHFIGSGTPTTKNPHGIAPEDIGLGATDTTGAISIHRRQQHMAMLGVHNSTNAGLVVVNPSALPNSLVVNQLATGDYAFVGGTAITAFLGSPLTLPSIPTHTNPGLYEVFVDNTATLQLTRRIDMTGVTQFPVFVQLIDLAEDWNTNSGPITVSYNPSGSGTITVNGRSTSLASLGGSPGIVRTYANANQNLWIDMWVYPASRPSTALAEAWQILPPVDATRLNSLVLATVHWSGTTGGHFGYKLGATSAGVACDKRFIAHALGAKGGTAGASLEVNAASRQGQVVLSKDSVQDLVLDWDKLVKLISDSSGIKDADSLHTHISLSSAITGEASRATAAESTIAASVTAETSRATAAETAEVSRATAAETALTNAMKLLVPVGTIFPYAGDGAADPSGFLVCDGRPVNRVGTYAGLFATIGTRFGAGDGVNTFNIPDLRSEFLRGANNMSTSLGSRLGMVAEELGRLRGSTQADAMQGHRHGNLSGNFITGGSEWYGLNYWAGGGMPSTSQATTGNPVTDGTNGAPRTASETRPRNVAVNYIIKV
jgi:microcystin-dependent protein